MTNLTYEQRQQLAYSNLLVRYPNPQPRYDWDQETYHDFQYGRGSLQGKELSIEYIQSTLPNVALPANLDQIKPSETWGKFECKPNCFTAFGITPDAYSYDLTISHARMTWIVNDGHTRIIRTSYDSNNYGEFIFVTIADPDTKFALDFYGRGYHEYRGIYYYDWCGSVNMHNEIFYKDKWQADLRDEFYDLLETYPAPYPKPKPDKQQQLFAVLADMTDDDGAITEMEDYDFGDWFDE